MILRKEILISEIDGEYIAVAADEASEYFHGMIKLNESGAFITELMKSEITKEEIASSLVEEYDVSMEKALKDVEKLATVYKEAGLLLE